MRSAVDSNLAAANEMIDKSGWSAVPIASPACGERHTKGFACTLRSGHQSRHLALASDGRVLEEWRNGN